MLNRRQMLGGLAAALSLPLVGELAGCSSTPAHRAWGTSGPVRDPFDYGLNAVLDLSHFNQIRDWGDLRDQDGILGVFHKASEGGDWTDPRYADRRAAAEQAGLYWGAYHFGTAGASGADQAIAFLRAAQIAPNTLMALDLELNSRNPDNSMDYDRAEEFVKTIRSATGRLPLVYVGAAWGDGEKPNGSRKSLGKAIDEDSLLGQCDLWLADYRALPELPGAWAKRGWRFWQYAGDGDNGGPFSSYAHNLVGVDHADRSLFAGGAEALDQYWQQGGAAKTAS